jgi:hypothetical protein
MIIAIPFRGPQPNKIHRKIASRLPFLGATFRWLSSLDHVVSKKLAPKNKKAHSVRVGQNSWILLALTETPPATVVSGP